MDKPKHGQWIQLIFCLYLPKDFIRWSLWINKDEILIEFVVCVLVYLPFHFFFMFLHYIFIYIYIYIYIYNYGIILIPYKYQFNMFDIRCIEY